jgi:hypothetical protein
VRIRLVSVHAPSHEPVEGQQDRTPCAMRPYARPTWKKNAVGGATERRS